MRNTKHNRMWVGKGNGKELNSVYENLALVWHGGWKKLIIMIVLHLR